MKAVQGRRILVTGLTAAFHPWLDADFVRHELDGERHWTILVPRDAAPSANGPVTLARASSVDPSAFDRIVEYTADGDLADVVPGGPNVLLVPELKPVLAKLRSAPDDFAANLQAGSEYLTWGTARCLRTISAPCRRGEPGTNAYPFFFLGQAAEAQDNRDAARENYAKAAALDPANAMFRDALRRVRR